MRAYAASSKAPQTPDAVLEVAAGLREQGHRAGRGEGAALVFTTAQHAKDAPALCRALEDLLGPLPFLGFVGASAYHGLVLEEGGPGLCVLILEGVPAYVRVTPQTGLGSHVAAALAADAPVGRARLLSLPAEELDAQNLLPGLDEQGAPVAGLVCATPLGQLGTALAPGLGEGPHAGLLSLDRVQVITGLAQGARPLGPSRRVTAAQANIAQRLDGVPALDALLADLPQGLQRDLARLRGALLAGIAEEGGNAFVMRHVVGIDPAAGAVAIAGEIKEGADLVFAMRDPEAARIDLKETLRSLIDALDGRRPLAVLVFNCMARDEAAFGAPLYDVGRVEDLFGGDGVPVVGISGSGEICTAGPRTEVFGYTAVVWALLADG
jgi:small ligand-binding sensory domain FIST